MGVPSELKKRMDRHPQVKWTQVARSAIERQLDDLEQMDRIASKSRLTQADIQEIARKIDEKMGKYFEERLHAARHRR